MELRDWMEASGFEPAVTYKTAMAETETGKPSVLNSHRLAWADSVTLRGLERHRWAEDLASVHALAMQGFQDNLLFAPLPLEAFLAQYAGHRGLMSPITACSRSKAPSWSDFYSASDCKIGQIRDRLPWW